MEIDDNAFLRGSLDAQNAAGEDTFESTTEETAYRFSIKPLRLPPTEDSEDNDDDEYDYDDEDEDDLDDDDIDDDDLDDDDRD